MTKKTEERLALLVCTLGLIAAWCVMIYVFKHHHIRRIYYYTP